MDQVQRDFHSISTLAMRGVQSQVNRLQRSAHLQNVMLTQTQLALDSAHEQLIQFKRLNNQVNEELVSLIDNLCRDPRVD